MSDMVLLPSKLPPETINRVAAAIANREGPYALDTARRRAALAYSVIKGDAVSDGVYLIKDGRAVKINLTEQQIYEAATGR
jgi:hypothetical protein